MPETLSSLAAAGPDNGVAGTATTTLPRFPSAIKEFKLCFLFTGSGSRQPGLNAMFLNRSKTIFHSCGGRTDTDRFSCCKRRDCSRDLEKSKMRMGTERRSESPERSLLTSTDVPTIGYWLLAIGYWLLAIGYWLLAIPDPMVRSR
jgi:hypothetical protein